MSAKPQNKPPADVPTDFGKHLRACMRCKLLKTFEQVRLPGLLRQGARVRGLASARAPCEALACGRARRCPPGR
jgi:hypothetical protein